MNSKDLLMLTRMSAVKQGLYAWVGLTLLYLLIALVSVDGLWFRYASSFSAVTESEKTKIRSAVTLYNKILTDIYDTNGVPAKLNELPAATQLRHEIYTDLGFLRRENLRLIYDNASLDFRALTILPTGTAEVTTYEQWNYLYRNLQTGAVAASIKGLGHGFRYTLHRRGGRWIVADVAAASVAPPRKNDGFLY